jgi:hypothetical protein
MKKIFLTAILIALHFLYIHIVTLVLFPVAEWSKAWVCGRSPAEVVGSKPASGIEVSLVSVVCIDR